MSQDPHSLVAPAAPSISVVIPLYNRTAFLAQAIDSVRAQTIASELEIIVVDDGSTTDVREAVLACGEDIRLVRQENTGVCAARNHGARLARAPIVAFLDDDDVLRPTLLECHKRLFRDHPDIDVAFADYSWFPSGKAPEPSSRAMARFRPILERSPHTLIPGTPPIYRLDAGGGALAFFLLGRPMFPSTLALRTEALWSLGGWDESIRHGRECFVFSARATFHKTCGFLDKDLMALRRGHAEHLTRNQSESRYLEALVLVRTRHTYPRALRRLAGPLIGVHCLQAGRRLRAAGHWRRWLHLTALGLRLAHVHLIHYGAKRVWRRMKRTLRRGA